MTKWLVAFVCLVGVVAVGIRLFCRPPARGGSSPAGDGNASIAQMQDQIAALRQAVDRSERLAGVAAGAAIAARVPAGAAPSEPAVAEATKSPAPPAISDEEAYHRLGQFFANETTDERWAAGAQAKARQHVVATLGSASNIRALECRRTTCKAAINYTSKEAYDHSMASLLLATSQPWTGTITYLPPKFGSDGSVEVDEYLFRDGANPLGDIYAGN